MQFRCYCCVVRERAAVIVIYYIYSCSCSDGGLNLNHENYFISN